MNTAEIQVDKISKNRTAIMGISMVLVVMFHSSFEIHSIPILQAFKMSGDIGVDIFLLVSGIGIYFSLQKNSNYREYIVRRAVRILPACIVVEGLWFVLQDLVLGRGNILGFVKDITSISFWLDGKLTTWYLAVLMVLQAVTPLYLKLLKKYQRLDIISVVLFLGIGIVIRLVPELNQAMGHLLIAILRVPAYVVGLSLGKIIYQKETLRFNKVLVLLIALLVVIAVYGWFPIYIPWSFKYIAYLPLAIFCTMALANLSKNRFLAFMGTYSLAIYLLHEKILWVFTAVLYMLIPDFHFLIMLNIVTILVTLICSKYLKI